MDTQNLKAFLLVAETGSFSLAAQKLHLTQNKNYRVPLN